MADTEVLALNKPSMKQADNEGNVIEANVTTPPAPTGGEVLGTQQTQGVINIQSPSNKGGEGTDTTTLPLGENYYAQTAPLTASWETNAQRQAGIKFKQDALAGKQTMIKSAGELQAEGQAGQTELALGEYKRAQSAEKAGWTGGYMLDQKRQGDYLRASIQAQMYGAQELQKYGMDTQLEAARLAYDMGKDQLAYQMYQEAQQLALTEAGMFGYYVSPEIKDMMNQLAAAENALIDNPDDERATTVKNTIENWFSQEGIDPQDLSTFGKLTMEREQYNQAKLDAMLASVGDDPSVFLARNTNGTYATDPATGQYVKLNFEDITKDDLFSFLGKDNEAEYKFADTAFKSYAKYLGQSTINSYFTSLEEGETPTSEGFEEFLNGEGNDRIAAYIEGLGLEKGSAEYKQIEALLKDNFNPTLTRDGVSISYTLGERTTPTQVESPGSPEVPVVDQENPEDIFVDNVNPYNNTAFDAEKWREKFNSYAKALDIDPNTYSINDYAQRYSEQYVIAKQMLANPDPKETPYSDWARNLHLTHNGFVTDKSYNEYLRSLVNNQLKNLVGKDLDFNEESLGQMTSTGYGLRIDKSKLTTADITKLESLGFTEGKVNVAGTQRDKSVFYINFPYPSEQQANGSVNIKQPQDLVKGYSAGSGWNDRYRIGSGSSALEFLLFSLYKIKGPTNLTNTTQGEGRF